MLFNSLQYLLFLPLVTLLYWILPSRFRALMLVIASYYFYMSWMRVYGLLLGGLTLLNYLLGLALATAKTPQIRRLILISGVTFNLGLLGIFKYTNFFLDTMNGIEKYLNSYLHIQLASLPSNLPIILPLGISFFAFEFIHYITDIYRGSAPIKNPIRFSLFASFFPSQIAGPIKRYQDFTKQLDSNPKFSWSNIQVGLWLILRGMFKKVALGDNLAAIVDTGFSATHLATIDAWTAVCAFALQLYFDFSGYTDIGIGSAKLLGIDLPENFNLPYLATSVQEYWRRWHISLSSWLRDYLFFPLGGSKFGEWNTARNLLITMTICGFWHGAAWNFVAFGVYHSFALILHRHWQRFTDHFGILKHNPNSWVSNLSCWFVHSVFLLSSYVVFRSQTFQQMGDMHVSMFGWKPAGEAAVFEALMQSTLPVTLTLYTLAYLLIRFAPAMPKASDENWRTVGWWISPPAVARAAAFLCISLVIVGMIPQKAVPFIYFQF